MKRVFRKFMVFLLFLFLFSVGVESQSGRIAPYSESKTKSSVSKSEDELKPVDNRNLEPNDSDVIRINTDLISFYVKVTERSGKPVTQLKQPDFRIFENDFEQEIAYFANEESPFTVALVLDTSYSSVFKIKEIQDAAFAFVNQLHAEDKVTVISFDEEVRVLCEPTNNRRVLKLAIESTKIASGTSLYDAVNLTLNRKLNQIKGRKAIILFSDGVDTTSKMADLKKNLADAESQEVLFFPLQYNTYDDVQKTRRDTAQVFLDEDTGQRIIIELPKKKGEREEDYVSAKEYLREIASRTGGQLYRVSSTTNLSKAFSDIALSLRKIYSLGYYSNAERKIGQRYYLNVRVNRPNLIVKAKQSYILRTNQQ